MTLKRIDELLAKHIDVSTQEAILFNCLREPQPPVVVDGIIKRLEEVNKKRTKIA